MNCELVNVVSFGLLYPPGPTAPPCNTIDAYFFGGDFLVALVDRVDLDGIGLVDNRLIVI